MRYYRVKLVLRDYSEEHLYEGPDWNKAYEFSSWQNLIEYRKRPDFHYLEIEMLTRNRGWEDIRRFA